MLIILYLLLAGGLQSSDCGNFGYEESQKFLAAKIEVREFMDRLQSLLVMASATAANHTNARNAISLLAMNNLNFTVTRLFDSFGGLLQDDREQRATMFGEIIGTFIASIEGTPTPAQFAELRLTLETIVHANEHEKQSISALVENQHELTQIIKDTQTHINLDHGHIGVLETVLNKKFRETNNEIRQESKIQAVFNTVTMVALDSLHNFAALKVAITSSRQGYMDKSIINTNQLSDHLRNISIPKQLRIPFKHDLEFFYSSKLSYSWSDSSSVHFMMKIPLVSKAEMRIEDTNYMEKHHALGLLKIVLTGKYFRYLSHTDIQKCTVWKSDTYCAKRKIEVALPERGTILIHDIQTHLIIFEFPEPMAVSIRCGHHRVRTETLPKHGNLTLAPECIMFSSKFTIYEMRHMPLIPKIHPKIVIRPYHYTNSSLSNLMKTHDARMNLHDEVILAMTHGDTKNKFRSWLNHNSEFDLIENNTRAAKKENEKASQDNAAAKMLIDAIWSATPWYIWLVAIVLIVLIAGVVACTCNAAPKPDINGLLKLLPDSLRARRKNAEMERLRIIEEEFSHFKAWTERKIKEYEEFSIGNNNAKDNADSGSAGGLAFS